MGFMFIMHCHTGSVSPGQIIDLRSSGHYHPMEQGSLRQEIAESRMAIDQARSIRLAGGPDEVHLESIAKLELRKGAAH